MKWLEIFKREDGCPSLARIVVTINLAVWLLITIHSYLFLRAWMHYDTYTCVTWVAFLALIANKVVECKYLKVGG